MITENSRTSIYSLANNEFITLFTEFILHNGYNPKNEDPKKSQSCREAINKYL